MKRFSGKNAIVTGANRGLGKSILLHLVKEGCNCWAIVRNDSKDFTSFCDKLSKENDVWVKPVSVNLSSEESIRREIKKIISEKKDVDFLINNAGIGHMGLFQLTKFDFIRQLYEVNLFAPMIISQMVIRAMSRQKKGKIINIASTAADEVYEGNAIYGSSKAALVAFTKSLAAEVYKHGIIVNAIAPGLINTEMSAIFEGSNPDEPIKHTALERKIEPDEIAVIVMNVLSDEMNIINGSVITINGGHK